ncbi:hypothetical protein [Psychrobacter ciconiae]|uniref:hypothetical protein n=1 Tax=Psychrobacter ciconiae TaxID=1553449 RepID=UPI0019188622|nr:hypothetical protein [Psychrobacter ciconiae]
MLIFVILQGAIAVFVHKTLKQALENNLKLPYYVADIERLQITKVMISLLRCF